MARGPIAPRVRDVARSRGAGQGSIRAVEQRSSRESRGPAGPLVKTVLLAITHLPGAPSGCRADGRAHVAINAIKDRAYSSRRNRRYLRRRQIKHTIPEPKNQRANCYRRGSMGGRPVGFDKTIYKRRTKLSERSMR